MLHVNTVYRVIDEKGRNVIINGINRDDEEIKTRRLWRRCKNATDKPLCETMGPAGRFCKSNRQVSALSLAQ